MVVRRLAAASALAALVAAYVLQYAIQSLGPYAQTVVGGVAAAALAVSAGLLILVGFVVVSEA